MSSARVQNGKGPVVVTPVTGLPVETVRAAAPAESAERGERTQAARRVSRAGIALDAVASALAGLTAGPQDVATAEQIDAALADIATFGHGSLPMTIANGDKAVWRPSDARLAPALAVFQRRGRTMAVLGEPVCREGDEHAVVAAIQADARRMGLRAVFYMVGPRFLPVLMDFGYRFFRLGAEAVIDLRRFSMDGHAMAYLRRAVRHAEGRGLTFEVFEPPAPLQVIDGARAVNDQWLEGKGIREKRFSQGHFSPGYLQRAPMGVVRDGDGRVEAYLNLLGRLPCPEVTVDLLRARRGVTWSLAHFLTTRAVLWAQAQGFSAFNLSMAPLLGTGEQPGAPWVERVAYRFSRLGAGPFDDAGLRQFKEHYHPRWEPRYLAWRGKLRLARVFWDTTSLVMAWSREDRKKVAAARLV